MRIISLFSGAGGLDLGLIQAGNDVVWANDIDKDAVATYRENIGNHIVCDDIKILILNRFQMRKLLLADFLVRDSPWQTDFVHWKMIETSYIDSSTTQ